MSGKCGFTASSSWLFGSSSVAQGASFDFFLFAMCSTVMMLKLPVADVKISIPPTACSMVTTCERDASGTSASSVPRFMRPGALTAAGGRTSALSICSPSVFLEAWLPGSEIAVLGV